MCNGGHNPRKILGALCAPIRQLQHNVRIELTGEARKLIVAPGLSAMTSRTGGNPGTGNSLFVDFFADRDAVCRSTANRFRIEIVHELMEARDERRLLRLQKHMVSHKLLIIDELGFVPLSKTGAELLFELISQRYERGATLITSNLPFDEWTETFGSERLTGALLDRLTHHVSILEMNGDSYRLGQSRARKAKVEV